MTSNGNSRLSYVVGGFYEHDYLKTRDYLTVGHQQTPALAGFFTNANQTTDAFSFFTNVKYGLTDTLKLIGGFRYNNERYDIDNGTCVGAGIMGYPVQQPVGTCTPVANASALAGGPVNKDSNASF